MKEVLSIVVILLFMLACSPPTAQTFHNPLPMKISSPAFLSYEKIPSNFTCKGENINPPLEFEGIPSSARSLVLIMEDPDAPSGTWIHWLLFNIPVSYEIKENSVPEGAIQGRNSWGANAYGGPCPPSGEHRYFFRLYAVDVKELGLDSSADVRMVEQMMYNHVVAEAELVGLFSKY